MCGCLWDQGCVPSLKAEPVVLPVPTLFPSIPLLIGHFRSQSHILMSHKGKKGAVPKLTHTYTYLQLYKENILACTDLKGFFSESSGEEQENTLHNHLLNLFYPKMKLWKGTPRLGKLSFSSRRGSMHELCVSHLCIYEIQVNKQNICCWTHTWVHTALKSRQRIQYICTTRFTISLGCRCLELKGFFLRVSLGVDPAFTHGSDWRRPAPAGCPHIGLLQPQGQVMWSAQCMRSYWTM